MSRRRVLRRVATVAAVGSALAAACAIYDRELLLPSRDAGPDAAPDVQEAGCGHAKAPPRPDVDGVGDAAVGELVFAVSSWDLGFGDGGLPLAYDLDDRCTCPDPESCVGAANAPKHCDDDAGRDNAGLALALNLSKLTSAFDDKVANQRLAQGVNGLLLRISDWNGEADDRSVELGLFVSNGTDKNADGGTTPLAHDGGDVWTVDPPSLVGGVGPPYVPKYVDTNAYVSGGYLVSTIDFPAALGRTFRGTFLVVSGAIVTAKIERLPTGAFALSSGRASGRLPTRNFLTGLQTTKDPVVPGGYLCGDSSVYLSLKDQICRTADISATPLRDNTNSPCDAISIAIGFTAEAAKLSGAFAIPQTTQGCGVTYTDDCR